MDRKRGLGDLVPGALVPGSIKFSGFTLLILSCYVLSTYLSDSVALFHNNRQSRPYGFSPQVVNAAQKQKHNRIVMIGVLVFMVVGSSLSYLIVRFVD